MLCDLLNSSCLLLSAILASDNGLRLKVGSQPLAVGPDVLP